MNFLTDVVNGIQPPFIQSECLQLLTLVERLCLRNSQTSAHFVHNSSLFDLIYKVLKIGDPNLTLLSLTIVENALVSTNENFLSQ